MSLQVILWVMNDAPVENHGELAVLYALADRASDDGTCCWPSQSWIAYRARCTDRTVRNHLKAMEDRGLIRRGDQRFVGHLPADRRPVVWDLDVSQKRAENPTGRKILVERPENLGSNDRKPVSDKPSLNHPEPSICESAPKPARKKNPPTKLPDDWEPTDKHRAKALKLGISDKLFAETVTAMRRWAIAGDVTRSNWDSTFNTFLGKTKPDTAPVADRGVEVERLVGEGRVSEIQRLLGVKLAVPDFGDVGPQETIRLRREWLAGWWAVEGKKLV